MKKNKGFTLVELLAVIVILTVILIIAVPKMLETINKSIISSMESSVKTVAGAVETKYQIGLATEKPINTTGECMTIGNLDDNEYGSCTYELVDGKATVTLIGTPGGKFDGLAAIGTKTYATCEYVYIITLNANGGSVLSNTVQIKAGDAYGILPMPVYGDKVFIGWYTSIDGGTKIESTDVPTTSTTLYAHWDSLLYNLIKLQAVDTTINFSVNSMISGENGVYKTSTNLVPTEDNVEVYFFRGSHTDVNNNVLFNGMCWKIIRTTELQGVRMIYNGTPVDGKCINTTGDSTQIGKSAYNTDYSDNAFIGYKYGTIQSLSYEATHTNTNNSTIKEYIDAWYKTNFVDKNSDKALQLEDSVYCNDRSTVAYDSSKIGSTDLSSYGNLGYKTCKTLYGTVNRASYYTITPSPSLSCANENDKFTVGSLNGNGALTYKVGLVTLDEVVLAGFNTYYSNTSAYQNTTNYLYTNNNYWSMSPNTAGKRGYSMVGCVDNTGIVSSNTASVLYGVRPVISLNHNASVSSGDGTVNTPYVVE